MTILDFAISTTIKETFDGHDVGIVLGIDQLSSGWMLIRGAYTLQRAEYTPDLSTAAAS